MIETFVPPTASHVAEASWDDESEDLVVVFQGGDTYLYRNVPRSDYRALRQAPSVGAFVRDRIAKRYMGERV